MQIRMRKNLVAVLKLGKHEKKTALDGLVTMPETTESQGIVKYVGPEVGDIVVGQRVFYGKKRDELYMNGETIMVMDEENIYATVEEAINETSPVKEA